MIHVANITVKYRSAQTRALRDISFDIGRGEYVAILGPNGSGKSTLIKALCGFIIVESGNIRILEKDLRYNRFGHDFFGDIGVVFQEPQGQFLSRDVSTEITSILQNLGLSLGEQKKRFNEIVAEFGLQPLLDSKPENLSGGQMQLVNLACAICLHPRLLLLDEPTTFLDPYYKNEFLSQITRLNKSELTVLHVTQHPDEALLTGRVIILNDGQIAYDGLSQHVLNNEKLLRESRLTRPRELCFIDIFDFNPDDNSQMEKYLRNYRKPNIAPNSPTDAKKSVPMLLIDKLHFSYNTGGFEIDIDKLGLNRGEVVGLVGPGGSGKSTLGFLLAGLLKPQSGQICIDNKALTEYPIAELRQKIGITWQLPDLTLIGPTVMDDLKFGLENLSIENTEISKILSNVGLNGFENRIVDTLSGGEKRKLALASILLANPQYLILDEPEAFLDPASQAEMAGIIKKAASDGCGVALIAHDLYFLSETAERIIGLADGKIIFDISAKQFFSDSSFLKSLGLPANPMIQFRKKLVHAGINIMTSSLDPAKIRESLQ